MEIIDQWRKSLEGMSGSLTTNGAMPAEIIEELLKEDFSLKEKLFFEEVSIPKFNGILSSVPGLDILAYLQKKTQKDCLTLFRAVRFPTYRRIYEMVSHSGYAVSNHEQERILKFYQHEDYSLKRKEIAKDFRFWTQPQERVVHGLPLFALVNDALQIHYSFRGDKDMVAIAITHIPYKLLAGKEIKLISNAALDLNYANEDRDYQINDFIKKEDRYELDYAALRLRGIDLHELYSKDLPFTIQEAEKIGIGQEFFLLDTYKIADEKAMEALMRDTKILKENEYFLHGFFGDQNIFARRKAKYLPLRCKSVRAF